MIRLEFLAIGLLVAISLAWPAAAAPQGEQRVVCHPKLACKTVTMRPGCRYVLLGGRFGSNHGKRVCDGHRALAVFLTAT
jgi:hypothetical protein